MGKLGIWGKFFTGIGLYSVKFFLGCNNYIPGTGRSLAL